MTDEIFDHKENRQRVIDQLCGRFGIDRKFFERYDFIFAARERVYLTPRDMPDHPCCTSAGLNFARLAGAVKPTTDFLQLIGSRITKNKVELTSEQTKKYISGETITPEKNQTEGVSDGHIALVYAGSCFACGLFKSGVIENVLPKNRRRKLEYL